MVVYWLMHFDNHCKTLNASVELYHEWSCRGHILNLGLKCLYQLPRQNLFPFHQTQAESIVERYKHNSDVIEMGDLNMRELFENPRKKRK